MAGNRRPPRRSTPRKADPAAAVRQLADAREKRQQAEKKPAKPKSPAKQTVSERALDAAVREPARGTKPNFGKFNGEPIEKVYLRISGMVQIDRLPREGEAIIVPVRVTATKPTVHRMFGPFITEYAAKIDLGVEADGSLKDRIAAQLQEVEDDREGRQQIPGLNGDTTVGDIGGDDGGEQE